MICCSCKQGMQPQTPIYLASSKQPGTTVPTASNSASPSPSSPLTSPSPITGGTKSILFAKDITLKVGDGLNTISDNCQSSLTQNVSQARKKFQITFTVLSEQTAIDINIGYLCGLNYQGKNIISVTGPGSFNQVYGLSPGITQLKLTNNAPLVLSSGIYSIIIESQVNTNTAELKSFFPAGNVTQDADDFYIREISISGNKEFIAGDKIHAL